VLSNKYGHTTNTDTLQLRTHYNYGQTTITDTLQLQTHYNYRHITNTDTLQLQTHYKYGHTTIIDTQQLRTHYNYDYDKKSMKISKGKSELVNRRTDNTIAKIKSTKGKTTIYKTLYRKLKIRQHELH
jgi:hypothetical protein